MTKSVALKATDFVGGSLLFDTSSIIMLLFVYHLIFSYSMTKKETSQSTSKYILGICLSILCFVMVSPLLSVWVQSAWSVSSVSASQQNNDVSFTASPVLASSVTNELLIQYKEGVSEKKRKKFRSRYALDRQTKSIDRLAVLNAERVRLLNPDTIQNRDELIQTLATDPIVELVEPNYMVNPQGIVLPPNDPDYPTQWNLKKIQVEQAWATTMGDPEVTIAVLDTGIDATHPDKPIAIKSGYDIVNDDANPADDHWHGTSIAGILAASTNNKEGIAGICPNCSILPVKVLGSNGKGTVADLVEGIVFATDAGVEIITIAAGTYANSGILQQAVVYTNQKGGIMVAASGNEATTQALYPAAYPGVLSVSATQEKDALWDQSNTGSTIDLVAPGVSILSTKPTASYEAITGTSAAAAHVAGALGLLFSVDKNMSVAQALDAIMGSTVDLGKPGNDLFFGAGRLDLGLLFGEKKPLENPKKIRTKEEIETIVGTDIYDPDYPLVPGSYIDQLNRVINSQEGSLKEYEIMYDINSDGVVDKVSVSDIIYEASSDGLYYSTDPRILLIFTELISHAVTDPTVPTSSLDTIFGVTKRDLIKKYLKNFPPTNYDNRTPEELEKYKMEKAESAASSYKTFGSQLGYIGDQTNHYYYVSNFGETQLPSFTFKDGTTIPASPNVNDYTYAIQKVLSELADSKEQWLYWVSKEPGSFYNLYTTWFFPDQESILQEEVEIKTSPTPVDTEEVFPPTVPFLSLPYKKEDSCGFSSLFDHWYPTYGKEGYPASSKVSFFTGMNLPFSSSLLAIGYNSYSGHDGLDVLARDCLTKKGKTIYAAADGVVITKNTSLYNSKGEPDPQGYHIWISHDINKDGIPDYLTRYLHLVEPSPLEVGDDVKAGDAIGTAGTTGNSDGVHLHFGVVRLIATKSTYADGTTTTIVEEINIHNNNKHPVIDPFGWWGDVSDPWLAKNPLAVSTWLWKSSALVDDADTSFFAFNTQNIAWNYVTIEPNQNTQEVAYNDNALYTYASFKPTHTWDDWSFWVGNLETAGKYTVWAYIPKYTIEGKTVTTEANYRVWYQGGYVDVAIDQDTNAGKWVELTTQQFDAGAKSAVRLIDEVFNQNNAGKVIWADAIQWLPMGENPNDLEEEEGGQPLTSKPDLTLLPSSITMNYSYKKWGTYYYTITLDIENKGGKAATEGEVCFKRNIWYSFLCGDAVSIGTLQAGETKKISLTVNSFWKLDNNPAGTLKIQSVYPQESDTKNNSYDIAQSLVLALAPDPGGVDFTFTELTGMAIDPKDGNIKFVMKSEEAGLDDPVIDLEGEQTLLKKIFLQALAIPNDKHWISLEVDYDTWDGQGMPPGYAVVPSPLEQTELAEIMLAADVELKFDNADTTPILKIFEMWTNLVKQSPYWAEIQASGFHDYPDPFQRKIYIAPGNITANQTDATIFFTDIDLDLKAEWGDTLPTLNFSNYNLSEAAKQDLLNRLEQYIDEADQMLKNHALELEASMFDLEPGLLKEPYKKLKSVYTAIAAAQWYKKQVALSPSLPYAELVDSEELEEIKNQIPFDKSYWDSQAVQFLEMDTCTYFSGQGDCGFYGSVELENGNTTIDASLTSYQEDLIEKTVEDLKTVVEGETTYSHGGEPVPVLSDIIMGSVNTDDLYFIAGKTYTFKLELGNEGPIDTSSFSIRATDTISLLSGEVNILEVGSWDVAGLDAWSGRNESVSVLIPEIEGKHSLTFEADPLHTVFERTSANNESTLSIDVLSNKATLSIHSPAHGTSFSATDIENHVLSLSATFIDPQEGDLSSSITWSSSLDGSLGTGGLVLPTALSSGIHTITASGQSGGGQTVFQKISLFVYDEQMIEGGVLMTDFSAGKKLLVKTNPGITWLPLSGFSSISSGGYHSCGLYNTSLYCWGSNSFGQLGTGNGFDATVPTKVADGEFWGGNHGISSVSAGMYHTCALKDGLAYCWGRAAEGQLGIGEFPTQQFVPRAVYSGSIEGGNKGISHLVAGGSHTCGIKNGSVYCWGAGSFGQLGAGYINYEYNPSKVSDGQLIGGNLEIDSIVLGANHTCALQFGVVYCWGLGFKGQLGLGYPVNYPFPARVWYGQFFAGNTNVSSIAAGANHTCALKEGIVYCWGSGEQGQGGTGDSTTRFVATKISDGEMENSNVVTIAGGGNHSCALKNGSIFCWGSGATGELGNGSTSDKPVPTQVTQNSFAGEQTGLVGLSLGLYHSCAVFVAGNGYCWGGGTDTTPQMVPYPQNQNEYGAYIHPALAPDTYTKLRIVASDVSENSVQIFLSFNGKSFVSYGFLKPGTGLTEIDLPLYTNPFSLQWGFEFAPKSTAKVLAVFAEHTAYVSDNSGGIPFLLSKEGIVLSSGDTYDIGTHIISNEKVKVPFTIQNIGKDTLILDPDTFTIDGAASNLFSIASSSFATLNPGQIGELVISLDPMEAGIKTARLRYYINGQEDKKYVLTFVSMITGQSTVFASTTFAADALVFDVSSGLKLLDPSGIDDVQIGLSHACGLKGGTVYCWGSGSYGVLGNGSTIGSAMPLQVSDGEIEGGNSGVSAIAVGDTHTCALKDGIAYCWGSAYLGQIGDGSPIYQYGLFKSTPTKVADGSIYQGNKDLTAIAAGSDHSCIIKKSIIGLIATVYCWGRNDSGQLGTWNGQHSNVPTYLSYGEIYDGTVGVDALKLGQHHSCARKNGSLYCWGLNSSGQLGIGTMEYYVPYPKKVITGELPEGNVNISSFDTGNYHSCAVASGKVYCWGANWQKQLGTDDIESSDIPRQVPNFPSNASTLDVALGGAHTCAHTLEHTVYCWGNNNYGQLGNGDQDIAMSQIPAPVVDKNGSALLFDTIMTGFFHTCGIHNGSLSCSGFNGSGELGIGTKNEIPYSMIPVPSIFGTGVFSMTLAPDAFTSLSFFGQDIASDEGISVKIGTNGKATIPLGSFKSGTDVHIFDLQPFLNTILPLTIEITFSPSESGQITHLYVGKKIIPFESINDTDKDGIVDTIDNCVFAPNDTQTDYDEDGIGDACDLPPGDITGDHVINVVDVECVQLLALWQLNPEDNPIPLCLSSGFIEDADVNCDGSVNVIDVQQLINIALTLSCNSQTGSCNPVLVTDIDADQDNIHNQCET